MGKNHGNVEIGRMQRLPSSPLHLSPMSSSSQVRPMSSSPRAVRQGIQEDVRHRHTPWIPAKKSTGMTTISFYSPYISVMSLRNSALVFFDRVSSFFFRRCLLMARIWSTAISAFFPAQMKESRLLHCGCSLLVSGQTTTVSRYLFIALSLTMATGRIFFISLPLAGLRSA